MADYKALFNCVAASPDYAGYPGTLPQLVDWCNEGVSQLVDYVSAADIWNSILDNKAADWDTLTDTQKDEIYKTLQLYSNPNLQGIPTAAGTSVRGFLVATFGGASGTIQDLVTKFTEQIQRARTYGWYSGTVSDLDIVEAIRKFGG